MTDESDLGVPDDLAPRAVLVLMFIGMALAAVVGAVPAMCAIAIRPELGLDTEQTGRFLASAIWGIIISFAIGGHIAQRIGYRIPMTVGLIIELIGLVLVALSSSFTTLLVANFLVGFGVGLYQVLLTPMALHVAPRHPTRLCNSLHAMFPLGQIFGATIAWQMLASGAAWQSIYYVFFGIMFVFLLFISSVRLPKPHRDEANYVPLKRFALTGPFLLILLAAMMCSMPENGPRAWIPTLIRREIQGTLFQAWLGIACFDGAMWIGRLCGAAVVHRLGVKLAFIVGALGSAACLLLASRSDGAVATIIWLCLAGLGVSYFWPTLMGYAQDRYPKAGPSLFSALSTAVAMGAIAAPWLIGGLALPPRNIQTAVGWLALSPLVTLACVLIIVRHRAGDTQWDSRQ